jgi:hypothetical protein
MKNFTFTQWVGLMGMIGAATGTAFDQMAIGVAAGIVLGALAWLVNDKRPMADE